MFKTPKHRSFDYKPVFYDEQKERKAELERMVEENRTGNLSDERRLELLRSKINHKWSGSARGGSSKQMFSQKIRFLLILSMLGGLVWFFFNWG